MIRWQIPALLLALASPVSAANIAVGNATVVAGHSTNLTVSLAGQGTQITGVGFDLLYDTSRFTVSLTAGGAATAAGKSAATNPISGGLRVIITGFNQTVIGDGSIADLSMSAAANAPAAVYPLTFANVSGTDAVHVGLEPVEQVLRRSAATAASGGRPDEPVGGRSDGHAQGMLYL